VTALYLILAALGLGFLIFIHELGHYFVARWVGIRVEVFSIGFGRAVIKWERDGVVWKVGWIPFGGYVKMAGEERPKEGGDLEPVEGGFLAARPIHRIYVALAGPVVNIIFALLAFSVLWFSGGRDRSYSEYSQRVGWVAPDSTLYAAGVRPGDRIYSYDGYLVHSIKDHAYGPMLADGQVRVQGEHFDPQTGQSTPFSLQVASYPDPNADEKGIKTLGFEAPAQYLVYEGPTGERVPMDGSGIEAGDRLLWVDGVPIFSMEQLKRVLNDGRALLTVERDGSTLLVRVPRVAMRDIRLTAWQREELGDWLYEQRGSSRGELWIPHEVSPQGVVEGSLSLYDGEVESPLQAGDRIVAVDGELVGSGSEIIDRLQDRQVYLIAQRGHELEGGVTAAVADDEFVTTVDWNDLAAVAASVGTGQPIFERDGLVLLGPVSPVPYGALLDQLPKNSPTARALKDEVRRIEGISDPEKRASALAALNAERQRLALGVQLKDRSVEYNPNPAVMTGRVVGETGRTLYSLVAGDLKPKWLSGPVGIVQVMQYSWALGAKEALFWLGFISLNLAFLNLLPIPILDGGNIVFSLYEMITRKRIGAKTMERLIIPFFVLLVGFFIYVTYQDLARIFKQFF